MIRRPQYPCKRDRYDEYICPLGVCPTCDYERLLRDPKSYYERDENGDYYRIDRFGVEHRVDLYGNDLPDNTYDVYKREFIGEFKPRWERVAESLEALEHGRAPKKEMPATYDPFWTKLEAVQSWMDAAEAQDRKKMKMNTAKPVEKVGNVSENVVRKLDSGEVVVEDKLTGTRLFHEKVEVSRRGAEIIIPEDMSIPEARVWLSRREEEENKRVAISEIVDAVPFEGAYAFSKALARMFGFTSMVDTPQGFWPDAPPTLIGVQVSATKTEQVAWGRVQIPAFSGGYLETGIAEKNKRLVFMISGEVLAKFKGQVKDLADLTRKIVREESIYRAKAVRVKFPKSPKDYDPRDCPQFMDVSKAREDELIFSNDVELEIRTSLFTPIEQTAQCREHQIPLKRGVLLEGPYGVGKTLTANITAKKAMENGWTFLYLSNVDDLEAAIHFAKSYQPCVIFAEDIDRVMVSNPENETSVRTEKMNAILNTIDGVDTKDMELLVLLTTNFVDIIDSAMMRPGRLDAVISVEPPDAEACIRLIQLYARGRLEEGTDLTKVGERLAGQIPATIREVVERSKLAAIGRKKPNEELRLHGKDLEVAAKQMLNHLRLMKPKEEDKRSDMEKAADVLGQALTGKALPATGTARHTNGNGKSSPDATA